jgi:Rrf2 family protein
MRLTSASNYAIRAVRAMARQDGNPSMASHDIAGAEGIPERFLLKSLGLLVKAGILHGARGPGGGYRLARPAAKISLLQIIEAVDGPLRGQAPGFQAGHALNRRVEAVCQLAADQARKQLGRVSVADLAATKG